MSVWIQSFPSLRLVAKPRLKKSVLPYYLPIVGGRIIGFIPFPRVLVICEMRSVSSWIWTRVIVSISYDDNHYTPGTFTFMFHNFFSSFTRNYCLSLFIFDFHFLVHHFASSVFLFLIIYRFDLLAGIKWSICISIFFSLSVSFSRTASWLCIHHLSVWWNFNFFHVSYSITFLTQSCRGLHSFCASLMHIIIIIIIIIIIFIYSFRVFHISVSWWFFTGV